MLTLVFPRPEHEALWRDILFEIENAGEDIIPYALKFGLHDYGEYLKKITAIHNDDGIAPLVPSTIYFLMEESEDRIIGAVDIRRRLNEKLLQSGGHIGYGIRPAMRRGGYATRLLSLALLKCSEIGLEKVLLTCDKENTASSGVILRNGGVLENEFLEENDSITRVTQRYWITLR